MELYLTLFTPGLMHVFDTACCSGACCHAWRIARSLCKGRVEVWPVNRPAVGPWDFWAGSVERIPDVVWAPYESLFAEGVAVFLTTPVLLGLLGTWELQIVGVRVKWGGKGSRYRRHNVLYYRDTRSRDGDCGCDYHWDC